MTIRRAWDRIQRCDQMFIWASTGDACGLSSSRQSTNWSTVWDTAVVKHNSQVLQLTMCISDCRPWSHHQILEKLYDAPVGTTTEPYETAKRKIGTFAGNRPRPSVSQPVSLFHVGFNNPLLCAVIVLRSVLKSQAHVNGASKCVPTYTNIVGQ